MNTKLLVLTAFLCCAVLLIGSHVRAGAGARQEARKRPDVLTLGAEAKLGPITFNHTNHTTKNYNIAGTGPIECIECHHTAQPASEIAKKPPLKTSWPLDRTTSLTAELLEKEPTAVGVIACRNCHARAGTKPAVWPEIPQIKHESSAAIVTLVNQQAFHRTCAACHDEVAKTRPEVKAPKTPQCTMCHKRQA